MQCKPAANLERSAFEVSPVASSKAVELLAAARSGVRYRHPASKMQWRDLCLVTHDSQPLHTSWTIQQLLDRKVHRLYHATYQLRRQVTEANYSAVSSSCTEVEKVVR